MDKKFLKVAFLILGIYIIVIFTILPNAFSGKWYFNPTILKIGKLQIRWYGLLIASSILLSYFIALKEALKEGVSEDDFSMAVIIGVIFGILGARLYYVAFNWHYYSKYPSEILKTWHGGMAIHGAILGAILSVFLYTRFKKNCTLSFFQSLDLFTFVLPLAQSIGRWGNFFNHEAYGKPTDLPWKMFVAPQHRMPGYEDFEYFHPTFLYESLWDIFVFLFLYYYMRNKREYYGEIFSLYLILYSIGRAFIEPLRLDSLMFGKLRAAVLISIIFVAIGIVLYLTLPKISKKVILTEEK